MTDSNPFADPLRFERQVPECAIVIFGANGDLTKRKLIPSLYRLAYERRLPATASIIGTSRTPLSDDAFRGKMHDSVKEFLEDSPFDEDQWTGFAKGLHYIAGDLSDPKLYSAIKDKLTALGRTNVLYYLSTQPSYYGEVVERLGAAGLGRTTAQGWQRIVVEKPFGHDLASARELNERIHGVFAEADVYRIDHYLGKETVQNILAFRFGNGIFEPLWNRRYVNHVQITAAESIGLEGRGAYYQEAGAVRDMIQNHLLQVMATVAMEPSAVYEPNAVRDERAKLLRSIRILRPEEVPLYAVAGQYAGFRHEPGVDPASQTPTYAAASFFIDNWRWAGVPFYIRSGKKLPKRTTEIAIQYNTAPHALFTPDAGGVTMRPNLLILQDSTRGRHLPAIFIEAARQRHAPQAGVDGFQLRFQLRRAVAHSLRDAARRRADRRRHAVYAPGHGGGQLAGGDADPGRLGQSQVRISELRSGHLGSGGVG